MYNEKYQYNEKEVFNYIHSSIANGKANMILINDLSEEFSMSKMDANSWINTWMNSINNKECQTCE